MSLSTLNNLVKKLTTIPVADFIREVVEDNKEYIEDKNAEQLERGEEPNGKKITPPYRPLTVAIKKAKGQPYDRVTLHDEGDFYKGIKVDLKSDSFSLDGTDPKTNEIIEKYGDVLGLSEQSKQEFVDDILKPELKDKIKKYLKK